jgi:hypothetical protein
MPRRSKILGSVMFAIVCACSRTEAPARTASIDLALHRGAVFLASRQSADGAVRSRTYAALRDGWSLTPLAGLALRMVPQDAMLAGAYHRAVDFVGSIVVGGAVRTAPEVSYPLYAYAIGALVLGAPDNRRHRPAHGALLAACASTSRRGNGWRADASYGGCIRAIPSGPTVRSSDDLLTANRRRRCRDHPRWRAPAIRRLPRAGSSTRQNRDGGSFSRPRCPMNKAGALAGGGYRSPARCPPMARVRCGWGGAG